MKLLIKERVPPDLQGNLEVSLIPPLVRPAGKGRSRIPVLSLRCWFGESLVVLCQIQTPVPESPDGIC